MRKLKLDLNDLTVTTFEMPGDADGQGTVEGRVNETAASLHELTCANTCGMGPGSCAADMTCSYSACYGSCPTLCGEPGACEA